MFTVKI